MLVARAHAWAPVAHLVDDGGALCGRSPRGDWLLSTSFPANCPKCLWAASRPRYALCESVGTQAMGHRHIRLLGHEGLTKQSVGASVSALCGSQVKWDLEMVRPLRRGEKLCELCRRLFVNST